MAIKSRCPASDLLQGIASGISEGIYTVAGLSKNAGKTSFLNQLIPYLESFTLGIMTTGRDGEATDVVFGNQKPQVQLPSGVLFTTVSAVLEKQGSALQIVDKIPFKAGTQQLWLVKTLREAEVEIVGPASVTAQIEAAHLMQSKGAQVVIIDGSIDRKSIALSPQVNGLFLVAGSSYGSLDKIRKEVERLYQLSKVPVYTERFGTNFAQYIQYQAKGAWHQTSLVTLLEQEQAFLEILAEHKPEAVYLPGVLTDSVLTRLKPSLTMVKTLVIRHPLQLHINQAAWDRLIQDHRVYTLDAMKIICLALNSWSVRGEHQDSALLLKEMRNLLPGLPVLDIREGWSTEVQTRGDDFDR